MSEIDFIENKTILSQEYKKELLQFNLDDIQLSIRYIDFLDWRLDEPIEIHINSNTTYLEFGKIINKYYPQLKVNILVFSFFFID